MNTVSANAYRLRRLSACLLALACLLGHLPARAVTLKAYFADKPSDVFCQAHPDVTFVHLNLAPDGEHLALHYRNTYELNAAMVTGTFEADVFEICNMGYDWNAIADKGFLADLSSSDIIKEAFVNMHPVFQRQLSRNGRILGIPTSLQFDFYLVNKQGFTAAGYTAADVPKTFPDLLSLLEDWASRQERNPNPEISVINNWAEEIYGPTSYIELLTEILIDSYIRQQQHAGLPITFDDPALIDCLVRIQAVGDAIYQIERVPNRPQALLNLADWAGFLWPGEVETYLLSPRLHDKQPHLLNCTMDILSVYERSKEKALALEYVEDFLTQERWFMAVYPSYFFVDGQPVKNPRYQESLEHWTSKIVETKATLANPNISVGDRNEAEILLARFEGYRKSTLEQEYDLSPEQLADYHAMVSGLSFPMASPYVAWTETGQNYETLRKRFVAGQLSAQAFIQELMRIARMVELEKVK
ncbi:MAG: hypothetical protein ACOX7B_14200 [Christensenellales bacterium]